MRLVIILLLLVVLPTAILSLVAGRSIQSRETLLHQRLERDAVRQIKDVASQFDILVQADSAEVIKAFQETVLSGMHNDCMEERVEALQDRSNFIKNVYLFMNPWNFIFPRAIKLPPAASVSDAVLLQQELIRQISVGMTHQSSRISFVCDGERFCFKPVPNMPELYVGFKVDTKKVTAKLKSILSKHSTHDIILRVISVKGDMISRSQSGVMITDSFNPRPTVLDPFAPRIVDDGGALAIGGLSEPLLHIKIAAFLVDEDSVIKAEALESRLIKWGILLLAIVIVTSSTILIRTTMNQAVIAKRRSEFVIGMSHDLRTPVAAMRVLADGLAAGRVESVEKQKKFLTTISSECERLGDMIERVLFFFKQEQGAMIYTMRPFDIGAMVRKIVSSVEVRSAGKMDVALEIDGGVKDVVGDAEALEKVVTNLLDNALKYGGRRSEVGGWRSEVGSRRSEVGGRRSEVGGRRSEVGSRRSEVGGRELIVEGGGEGTHEGSPYVVRVFVERWRGRDWVVVSVADGGVGIAFGEQKKIFKRFYRVGSETHSHVGGIGLGLSLCADIVKAHRGRLIVKSVLGEGAEFSVWLRGE